MARKDLAARSEYNREYRQRPGVRERRNARQQAARQANLPEARAKDRARYAENPDTARKRFQRWYPANRERVLAAARVDHLKSNHGLTPAKFAEIWQAQAGCCYLCGDELADRKVHVDHDHSCCPPRHSCPFCRRGLACPSCNTAIGLFRDAPERMRAVADALERAQIDVRKRLAARPEQLALVEGIV